ncbi:MAG: LamG domain-containing protein [Firmicutes bacterium]|nr:LamG domain-containing protein [Bacillota bacterium]
MARKLTVLVSLLMLSLLVSSTVFASAGWVTVDVTSDEVSYYGTGLTNWRRINAEQAYNSVEIYSDRDIHEVKFTFEGTSVRWLASVGPNRGKANVWINDKLVAENLDLYAEEMEYQVPVFETTLELGVHTIKVRPTGEKNAKSTFAAITVDAFQYLPSLLNKITEANELLKLVPTAEEVEQKLVSFDYPAEVIAALEKAIAEANEAYNTYAPGEQGQISALAVLDEAMTNFKNSKIPIARPSLYSFEGNLEDSLAGFTALTEYELTYEEGVVGQALNLDGNVFIQVPGDHPIATSEQMTVAAWVNWREGNHWQRIVDFGNNTSQYFFITPNSGSNTLRFAITSGRGEQWVETAPLPKNEWVHVAVTLGNGEANLYVNGELKASGKIDIVPADFEPALNYVGNSQWPDPLFNGLIDELYISNVALSAEEIVELMNAR